MKQLSQLKQSETMSPVFALFDSTLLNLSNQQFINDTQIIINNTGFGPLYGVYRQDFNHIIFDNENQQYQTDDETKPSYTGFCENGLLVSLGSTLHLLPWDSLAGHQPLPVNIDDNPNPMLMVKVFVNNNDMISMLILPEVQVFLIIDLIMKEFKQIDETTSNLDM